MKKGLLFMGISFITIYFICCLIDILLAQEIRYIINLKYSFVLSLIWFFAGYADCH